MKSRATGQDRVFSVCVIVHHLRSRFYATCSDSLELCFYSCSGMQSYIHTQSCVVSPVFVLRQISPFISCHKRSDSYPCVSLHQVCALAKNAGNSCTLAHSSVLSHSISTPWKFTHTGGHVCTYASMARFCLGQVVSRKVLKTFSRKEWNTYFYLVFDTFTFLIPAGFHFDSICWPLGGFNILLLNLPLHERFENQDR